jgi:enoyl-CoA hydratase/carnithine racemase
VASGAAIVPSFVNIRDARAMTCLGRASQPQNGLSGGSAEARPIQFRILSRVDDWIHASARAVTERRWTDRRPLIYDAILMASKEVRLQREGRVVTLTLDRPGDENRLTLDVLRELERIVHELAGDAETQAVVLTGAGSEHFSMGILNPVVRAGYTKEQILELVRTANRLYDALEALPQIVIAALNGATRAGAAELSLACDMRLAASHATFALPEALWGGFPGAGGPVRLPMLVGRARALEIMCTGRALDAAELERLGLVLAVYPAERLLPEAQALAARIAASGPLATRGAKRIVRTRLTAGFTEARSLSDALRHALEWSRDVDEGMAAHREGRAPRFTGR